MVCGRTALSWEELSHGYLIVVGPCGLLATIGATEEIDCCQKMYKLKTVFQEMQQQEPTSEEGVLGLATLYPAKQAPAKTGLSIVPDCTITAKKCFRNAAIAIIKDAGNLDVFMDPTYRSKEAGGVDLPSWMPHWGDDPFKSSENKAWGSTTPFTPFLSIAVLANIFRQEESQVSACGESSSSRYEPRIIDGSILVLEGHTADSIAAIGPALDGKLEDDSEEKWAQYAKQHTVISLMNIPSLVIQVLVRVATFVGSLLSWEELAFANPACPTRAEQESYIRTLLSDRMFQNIDISLGIYQRDWSPLLGWLRWLSPLKALGARPRSVPG
ncbi:hypothetical protein GGR54DRAFT_650404 [Hypoxylon sp. NC1633]|nr:hypothetical protein GGR54DRAFT_650404 [Hypoxylon sp. NC1633]